MCTGSRLLTAPLVGHGPAKQLLYMAGHVHRVIEVKVSISIQHGVTPEGTLLLLLSICQAERQWATELISHLVLTDIVTVIGFTISGNDPFSSQFSLSQKKIIKIMKI